MDRGAWTRRRWSTVGCAPRRPAGTPRPRPSARRRRLGLDLTLLGIVGVLLIAAGRPRAPPRCTASSTAPPHSSSATSRLLADGRAADALAVPGVAVDSAELEAAGLPATASDALLRRDALATLTDIEVDLEETEDENGMVVRDGDLSAPAPFPAPPRSGCCATARWDSRPTWRFATSPLALMDLTVKGSMTFDVNGFSIDKRQVSPDGADADPQAAVSLLVFSRACTPSRWTRRYRRPGAWQCSRTARLRRCRSTSRRLRLLSSSRSCSSASRSSWSRAPSRTSCSRPPAPSASSCRTASSRRRSGRSPRSRPSPSSPTERAGASRQSMPRPHRGRHPVAVRWNGPPRVGGRPVRGHRQHRDAPRRQGFDHGQRPE